MEIALTLNSHLSTVNHFAALVVCREFGRADAVQAGLPPP
jgi:hypothetical protein